MACAGHVLSEGFRVARDVLANVGGNRARPQIIERACRGSDENLIDRSQIMPPSSLA
jgi:hypothetical protein